MRPGRKAWLVAPPTLGAALDFDVNLGIFTLKELQEVLAKLKAGKAPGTDDVPPDFWKALQQAPLSISL